MFGRRRRGRDHQPTESNPYEGLRDLALRAVERGLPEPTPDHPDVSGVVVDIPSHDAYATVVAMTDNTTSMYTSTGGGRLGAGEHPDVAAATHALLATIQPRLEAFDEIDDDTLPAPGSVRFHVLTPTGTQRKDVPEDCFWGRAPHDLMPVIGATQEVISAMRRVSSG